MGQKYVEERLVDWAVRLKYGQHDPSWRPTSTLHRFQTEGAPTQSGNRQGDGGMGHVYDRHHNELAAQQRTEEIDVALRAMKQYDRPAYGAVTLAFLDSPGKVITAVDGARELGVDRKLWRVVYERGLAFVDGALAMM